MLWIENNSIINTIHIKECMEPIFTLVLDWIYIQLGLYFVHKH